MSNNFLTEYIFLVHSYSAPRKVLPQEIQAGNKKEGSFLLLPVSDVLLEQRATVCCKLQAPGVGELLSLPAAPLTPAWVPLRP